MAYDPTEQFAGNSSINATLHEILADFKDPSRARMLKAVRHARKSVRKHGTAEEDAKARHVFREFLVAHRLNCNGMALEYSRKVNNQTPDWYDESNHLLLEVFTCERGGTSDPVKRVAETIAEKVDRYSTLASVLAACLVVAVHGDFESLFESDDCEKAISDHKLFQTHDELSGVIYFAETSIERIRLADGSFGSRQLYGYDYFENATASRKIDLVSRLFPPESPPK